MRERICVALGVLIASVACSGAPAPAASSKLESETCSVASSYASVAPILKEHCASCHAADGSAADDHDFSSEFRVYAARNAIARQVSAHAMPPRPHPAPREAELQVLVRYASCAKPIPP